MATAQSESCMTCHNGSSSIDYSGPGIENPHPFPGASMIACTTCHGGNGNGMSMASSHIPAPPEIGDRTQQQTDRHAWYNDLTYAGLDRIPDYVVNGKTYHATDYLRFKNPGDLRVTTLGLGCGKCHASHSDTTSRSLLATQTGFYSGANYYIGIQNSIPAYQGLWDDTAGDIGFRATSLAGFQLDVNKVGLIGTVNPAPEYATFGVSGGMNIYNNRNYDSLQLDADLNPDNSVMTGSRLANLFTETVNFQCSWCHLGSAGLNNRAGDFRSSGCTTCHMPYSLGGRSQSSDPNVNKTEPLNTDAIQPGEHAHVRTHQIRSRAKTLGNGATVQAIDDITCAGCHQGSNRTVLQYWGIRLDQNQDDARGLQYPSNPVTWRGTANNTAMYDPAIGNRTFNGRNSNQYLSFEDYDGDGRNDIPDDIHHEKGLGCIDCHAGNEMHGSDPTDPTENMMASRAEEQFRIHCQTCHGNATTYAGSTFAKAYDGTMQNVAVDDRGKPIDHVVLESDGNWYLYSKMDGRKHFVPQTHDVVVNTGKVNPFTTNPVYSDKASYAMGRDDGNPATSGIGPQQVNLPHTGFSHADNLSCAACHASWSNSCVGCHLKGRYNTGNNYSTATGDRIVYQQTNADFTYISPIPFTLGIDAENKITVFATNTKVFYQYRDINNNFSRVYAFSDRNGMGANPNTIGSLGHNSLLAHSIRGKVSATKEGPRYCVACHLNTDMLANYGAMYDTFRTALQNNDFASLDFNMLKTHIGKNPGNQLNSPIFVHMTAGLGSGVFLFSKYGEAENPIDTNGNRVGSNGQAPMLYWDPANVALDLDRIVDENGVPTGSNNHSMLRPGVGPNMRDGAPDWWRPGPLGATLIRKLSDPVNGVVLDSWIDADGNGGGNVGNFVPGL